jgi:cytochrome b561
MDRPVLQRYGNLSIAMHWLMVVLIALTYLFIELRTLFPRDSPERAFMRATHASLGLLILLLVSVRLAAVWRGGRPRVTPALPAWQAFAARTVHVLLYLLMIAMPILGWLLFNARGGDAPFFGLELPALIGEDEALGKRLRAIHGWIGSLGYALIGLHSLAAIVHHWVWRDDTLRRMLPGR